MDFSVFNWISSGL